VATAYPDSFISTSVSDKLQQPSNKCHKNDDTDQTSILSLGSAALIALYLLEAAEKLNQDKLKEKETE